MSGEIGGGENYFNNESLSKSFKIADSFRKEGVLGEKKTDDERNIANEKVSEILNRSFPIPTESSGQVHSVISYDRVSKMVEISRPESNRTPIVQENAKKALFEVGLALSQDSRILNAATEGIDELNKLIPDNLKGIEPYILSSILTKGKDDIEGQEMVSELVDLFKLKKKSDERPGHYEKDLKEASDELFNKLWDKRENLDAVAVANGTEGRIEAAIGYTNSVGEVSVAGSNGVTAAIERLVQVETDRITKENEAAARARTEKLAREAEEKRIAAERLLKQEEENKRKHLTRSGTEMKYPNEGFSELNEKEQLEYVEERLNIIENWGTDDFARELSLSDFKDPLKTILSTKTGPEFIRDIIDTRLSLKQIGEAMLDNFGSFGEHGDGIARIIKKVKGEGFDLSPKVMKTFFMNKIGDLKTAEAWDLMEKANFHYKDILREATEKGSDELKKLIVDEFTTSENFCKTTELKLSKGTPLEGQVYNYQNDIIGQKEKAKIVRKYLIEKLMNEKKIGEKEAEKSIQLAEFMYNATMESCLVDWDFLNGNDYGELVNLQYCRRIDGSSGTKGKLVGPYVNRDIIKSVTPGWVRSFCGLSDSSKEILSADIIKYGLEPNQMSQERGLSGKGTYEAHFISVITGKILKAKQLITIEDPPLPKDALSTQFWQKQFDYFQKIKTDMKGENDKGYDPNKEDMTRAAYFAGQLELAFNSRNSSWTVNDFKMLERIVTKDIIANKGIDGKQQGFLTEKEWEWVKKEINYKKALRSLFWFDLTQAMLMGGLNKSKK